MEIRLMKKMEDKIRKNRDKNETYMKQLMIEHVHHKIMEGQLTCEMVWTWLSKPEKKPT